MFVELSQEGARLVRIRITESQGLSRRVQDETKRKTLFLSAEGAVEGFMELIAEMDVLMPQSTDYKVAKKNGKQKLSKQEVIQKAMLHL